MDGNQSGKAMDSGANSTIRNVEGSDSIHESSRQSASVGGKATGTGVPVFNKDGAIGSAFKADGAIGQVGERIGGPLASDGMIGKNFNPDGAVGGKIQETLGQKKT